MNSSSLATIIGLVLVEVVNPGTAATPIAFGQFSQLASRNGFQDVPRLGSDVLAMAQMTRLVVCHQLHLRPLGLGLTESDFDQPFMDILHFPVPFFRPRPIDWVILE